MDYANLVYGLLESLAWSITPALPTGAPGTRPAVGTPEKIPDVVFIARPVTVADGVDPGEVAHLNGFITDAGIYHDLYGFPRNKVGSFEAILKYFEKKNTPIGRVRLVSHGDDAYLFFPMFENGDWGIGIQDSLLQALQNDDEGGIRFLLRGDASRSPLFTDIVGDLTDRIRVRNSDLLAPFGMKTAGSPLPTEAEPYFQVVNDLYQTSHGTMIIDTEGVLTIANTAQRTTLTDALTVIENTLRPALAGKVLDAAPITDTDLRAFRDAVLVELPGPFGLFGSPTDLAAGTVAAVGAATAAVPPVEVDLLAAFAAGPQSTVFGIDQLTSLVRSLELFRPGVLDVGGGAQTITSIRADPNLEAFAFVGVDLFMLKNGVVLQNGVALTAGELTTLRSGLIALATIRAQPLVVAGSPFTAPRLTAFRDALENIPYRQSTIFGEPTTTSGALKKVQPATVAMQDGFRGKLEHFRGLMQPADASAFDVRGCLVGATPSFLTALRDFMGTANNRPVVSAPEWLQSYPRGGYDFRPASPLFAEVESLMMVGRPPDFVATDVGASAATWRDLVTFDPHFDFMTAMFAAGASKRDLASLRWRVFQTATAPQGIPVLGMEASRVDTIDTLTLSQVIERFRDIFEIPAASVPDPTTLGQLNSLQPLIVRLETLTDAPPSQPASFITDLTTVRDDITKINMPGPAAPPTPAGSTLIDAQNFASDIGTYVETLLDNALNAFFVEMGAAIGKPNARLNYFYNVGLPLLLQSVKAPDKVLMSVLTSSTGAAGTTQIGASLRSWMRIQWEGTAAQTAAMNAHISAVPMDTNAQRIAAAQLAKLGEEDPTTEVVTDAAVSPMPKFGDHIVRTPP
jgi:hypothetical protein